MIDYEKLWEDLKEIILKQDYDIKVRLSQSKPEPKFKVGDLWWYLDEANFMWHPKPKSLTITEENKGWYRDDDEWFPSRNALIQSQIDYWQSLKEPDVESNQVQADVGSCQHEIRSKYGDCIECGHGSCQHESDGKVYLSNPSKYLCKKCGEFYR